MTKMRNLTKKEAAIMGYFWERGALFVRELRELYPDPKPHFNTLSTQVRTLEADGFLRHKTYGPTYQYEPVVSREAYQESTLTTVVDKLFGGNSYLQVVSAFVKDEKITVEELKELIAKIENK